MEEVPLTIVSRGVLRSLPAKLDSLLKSEKRQGARLNKQERNEISHLKDKLKELKDSHLMEPPHVEVPPAPTGSRYWVKDVCELLYDIDDFVDQLSGPDAVRKIHRGKLSRMPLLCKGRSQSRWVADKFSRFTACLQKAIEWHKERKNGQGSCQQHPTVASDEHPLPPVHTVDDAARLIGVESSMNKVGQWLTDEAEKKLRVVSIVGLGGVGKTTLAKQLYLNLGRQFHCRAFLGSSKNPDMKRLLTSLLLQVRPHQQPDGFESGNLINTIRAYLQNKKYLIVIDDLWVLSTWDIVSHAFPDDNCCSRVLTTTEVDTVARRCCGYNSRHILKMEPLGDVMSSQLFFSKVTSNKFELHGHLRDISFEILRKCGGLPLAIIAIASLLARPTKDSKQHWNYIWKSLSSSFNVNPSSDVINQIIILCYNHLPDHLKACMLYLSIYQENHIICKADLVRRWIIEGFICQEEAKGIAAEVASNYFDELVNRGMIQPADTKYNGEVQLFTVHYMILNVIRQKSIEGNFVTAIDHSETNIRLVNKVRRLSLHFSDAEDAKPPENLKLSQLRSLVFFGLFKCLPSIEEFQLLRVLILHLWSDQDNISLDLTTVCKLYRLRYLEVECNVTLNLQSQLQGLQSLVVLKINSRVTEVPDIADLPCLLHLSLPENTNMPNGIRNMASLETLECFNLSRNSHGNVLSLREISNLWDLRLTFSTVPSDNLKKNMDCLAKILPHFNYLKVLTLLPAAASYNADIVEVSASSIFHMTA